MPTANLLALPRVTRNAPVQFVEGVLRLDDETLLLLAPERLQPGAPLAWNFAPEFAELPFEGGRRGCRM